MGFRGKDLTGQIFGQLTVLSLDEDFEKVRGSRQRRWICQCSCGTIKSIIGAELTRTNNSQKSCGCAAKIRQQHFGEITFQDLTGKDFGQLHVLFKTGTNKYGYAIWSCLCSCGKMCEVSSRELLNKDTISCGCQKNSYRETLIELELQKYNISYKKEYKFEDLKDKTFLRFDFAIFNFDKLVCLIEHQGKQHFDSSTQWHTESLILHDKMKKEYCIKNSIPLYEICYTDDINKKILEILQKEELTYRT